MLLFVIFHKTFISLKELLFVLCIFFYVPVSSSYDMLLVVTIL